MSVADFSAIETFRRCWQKLISQAQKWGKNLAPGGCNKTLPRALHLELMC